MNFSIPLLSRTPFSFFKDHSSIVLTPLQKKVIFIATAALASFVLAYALIKHCGFKKEFKTSSKSDAPDQTAVAGRPNRSVEETGNVDTIKLEDKLKTTEGREILDLAFTGKFAIDQLPLYPLNSEHPVTIHSLSLENMTHPVMKCEIGSREFILIAVSSPEDNQEGLIILNSFDNHDTTLWQQCQSDSNYPVFFKQNFFIICHLANSEIENFQSFQKLLNEGESQDTTGKTWRIKEEFKPSSKSEEETQTPKPAWRKTLDLAFTGKYAIDQLPLYPSTLTLQNPFPKLNHITHSIMKGKYRRDGIEAEFIVITVKKAETGNHAKIITLYQDSSYLNRWIQVESGTGNPVFFNDTGRITYTNGKLIECQAQNFKLFQTLLDHGKSQDTNGKTWELVNPADKS